MFFGFLFGRELIHGPTAGVTRVNGRTITCMDSEYIPGQMAEGMKVSISMTRNMALGSTSGLMADNI